MPKFKTGEDFYHRIYLIFNALIAVSLLPFSLIFLDIQKNGIDNPILSGYLGYSLSLIIVVTIIFFSYRSFQTVKRFRKEMIMNESLREKLNQYYQVFIKHHTLLSIFGLLVTILLFLTKLNILIVFYVILLVLLSINRPTLKSIIGQLRLSDSEQEILYQKKEIDN